MPVNSGLSWIGWANTNAANSTDIEQLEATFRQNVKDFKAALEAAGATVSVNDTKRSDKRAYLFHWSWKISLDKCKASDATAMAGVDITWDHGDDAKSKAGAQEMVTGFGLAVPPSSTDAPSLTSRHIEGKAIDMDITWTGNIKVKNKAGLEVEVAFNANPNANTVLHTIGATYGVIKRTSDAPHWSTDGH